MLMWAPAAILALGLAGCGAAEPRIALPLVAAEGADPLVKDFIEICSQAIVDRAAASAAAGQRGWKLELVPAALDGIEGMHFTRSDERVGEQQLQLFAFDYPHMHNEACNVFWGGRSTADSVDLGSISKVAGVEGKFWSVDQERGGRGLWSFVGPSGDPVTINVLSIPNGPVQMTMTKLRRTSPGADQSKN
jgi:hypothetical protein